MRDCSRIVIYGGRKNGINPSILRKILKTKCSISENDLAYVEVNDKFSLIGVLRDKAQRTLNTLQKHEFGQILKMELRRTQREDKF